ncbi:hypothetical protein KSS87_017230 [Heliosperma pusillum]|nr:hypothetical protein KSS87_017230 [Heliosperma pusillum]
MVGLVPAVVCRQRIQGVVHHRIKPSAVSSCRGGCFCCSCHGNFLIASASVSVVGLVFVASCWGLLVVDGDGRRCGGCFLDFGAASDGHGGNKQCGQLVKALRLTITLAAPKHRLPHEVPPFICRLGSSNLQLLQRYVYTSSFVVLGHYLLHMVGECHPLR